MKKLIAIVLVSTLVSCETEIPKPNNQKINYQIRLQVINKNSDTTYSETKTIR